MSRSVSQLGQSLGCKRLELGTRSRYRSPLAVTTPLTPAVVVDGLGTQPGFDASNFRFRINWTLFDGKTFAELARGSDTARTRADGWARFEQLVVTRSMLPDLVLFVPVIELLQNAGPVPLARWQCTVVQEEPPCTAGGTTACLVKKRFKVTATRNGVPLNVTRLGDGFAIYNNRLEVQVFGQCQDPATRGFTVQIDSFLADIVVGVANTWTGASDYFFPQPNKRLLAFGTFPTCP